MSYYELYCVPMFIERIYCGEEEETRKFYGCRGDTDYTFSGGQAKITQFSEQGCGGEEIHVLQHPLVDYCLDYQGEFFHISWSKFALMMVPCPHMRFYPCTDGVKMTCDNNMLTYERFDNNNCRSSAVNWEFFHNKCEWLWKFLSMSWYKYIPLYYIWCTEEHLVLSKSSRQIL